LTNSQAAAEIQSGLKLKCPVLCPNEIYGLMKKCWNFAPDERPHFAECYLYLKAYSKKTFASKKPPSFYDSEPLEEGEGLGSTMALEYTLPPPTVHTVHDSTSTNEVETDNYELR